MRRYARDKMMQRPMVWKSLLYGGGMGLAVLLLVGIPSGVIPNQFFVRPLDARPTDYLFLGIITAMAIALGATYGVPTCLPASGYESTWQRAAAFHRCWLSGLQQSGACLGRRQRRVDLF